MTISNTLSTISAAEAPQQCLIGLGVWRASGRGEVRDKAPGVLLKMQLLTLWLILACVSLVSSRVLAVSGGASGGSDTAVGLVIDGKIYCSGVLVSPRLVLTAAHCLLDNIESTTNPKITNRYMIYWGDGVYGGQVSENLAKVSEVTFHPQAQRLCRSKDPKTGKCVGNDLAAVVLRKAVSDHAIAKLPTALDMASLSHDVFDLVGYGLMVPDDGPSGATAQKGLKNSTKAVYDESTYERGNFWIWVKSDKGSDIESGDSGGPLLVNEGNGAIVFGVLHDERAIGNSNYTSLYPWESWIDAMIKSHP